MGKQFSKRRLPEVAGKEGEKLGRMPSWGGCPVRCVCSQVHPPPELRDAEEGK